MTLPVSSFSKKTIPSVFPKVCVPDYFLYIMTSLPGSKYPKPPKPSKPDLKTLESPKKPSEPSSIGEGGCFGYAIFFLILGGLMIWLASASKNGSEAGLYGIFLLIIAIFIFISLIRGNADAKKTYDKNLSDYYKQLNDFPNLKKRMEEEFRKALKKYEEDIEDYQIDLEIYQEHLAEIREQRYVSNYRRDRLTARLKNNVMPVKVENSIHISKGVTEDYFFNQLQKSLNFDILQNHVLKFGDSEKGYYPDIVIYDNKSNLIIDIEIDEPYIGSTGEPIHFEACGDEKRDEYFVNNGWIVIRFTEEQIVKHTMKCIDFINYLISSLMKNDFDETRTPSMNDIIQAYPSINNLYVSGWTKDDAHKKAFARYRNSYLGFALSEKLTLETQTSMITNPKQLDDNDIDDLPF